jgi:UDP-glucose 4-epimerase
MSGLDYLSFRLANIIGPRNLSGPAPVFYRRLREGKSCFVTDTRRDFIFVDDLVDLVTRALDTPGVSGVFHASSGGDYAIKEFFAHVASSMGFEHIPDVEFLPRNPADAPTIMLDPSETHRAFGWTASTPLGKAIHAAIAWYDKHGVDHAYTHFRQRAEN